MALLRCTEQLLWCSDSFPVPKLPGFDAAAVCLPLRNDTKGWTEPQPCPFQNLSKAFHNQGQGTQHRAQGSIRPWLCQSSNESVWLQLMGLWARLCRAVTCTHSVQCHAESTAATAALPLFTLPQKWDAAASAEITHSQKGQNVSAGHQGTARRCLPGEILSGFPFRFLRA